MMFYAILMAHWTSPTLSNCSQIMCNMVDFAHSQTSHPRASLPTTPRFNKKKTNRIVFGASVHAPEYIVKTCMFVVGSGHTGGGCARSLCLVRQGGRGRGGRRWRRRRCDEGAHRRVVVVHHVRELPHTHFKRTIYFAIECEVHVKQQEYLHTRRAHTPTVFFPSIQVRVCVYAWLRTFSSRTYTKYTQRGALCVLARVCVV